MSQLHVTNSLTRVKEKFEPLNPPYVGMYVCGPTVSGESHLGHARPYVTFDVVFRYLKHLGYKVRYVRNITDAGHFEEEGRESEDKVSKKAKLEQLEPMELVQKYTNMFHDAMDMLGNERPSIEPTATGHIVEQIDMIQDIIKKGLAYEVNGSVYFDVTKYAKDNDYGKLSGRVIDEMIAGSRELEGQGEKRNPADFALWKNAPPEHIQRWNSPWGEGFPGWHIECSAMATKYLGTPFDIHGGGMDLQFPHHESEIAQTKTVTGKAPAKYWMHNNTITLRELFTGANDLLSQAYHPMVIRFFILQTHYRSTLDFSNAALGSAEKGFERLMTAYELSQQLTHQPSTVNPQLDEQVKSLCAACHDQMNDDLNTAQVMASLFELTGTVYSIKHGQLEGGALSEATFNTMKQTMQLFVHDILGLKPIGQSTDNGKLDEIMNVLIELRKEAKSKKDFATSDAIRNQLQQAGVQLKDEKDGTVSWSLN